MRDPGIFFILACLPAVLAGASGGAMPPLEILLAERDATGAVRLLARGVEGAAPLPAALAAAEWKRFGLRGFSLEDPATSGAVVEIAGELPRLRVRGDYQLVAFRGISADGEGLAALGPWGARVLLSSAGGRYRLEDSGAAVSPGGAWIGLVFRGLAAGEVLAVDVSGKEPRALPVILPADAGRLEPRSLALTARALFIAGQRDGYGWSLYRASLEVPPGAAPGSVLGSEMVAGPFEELEPFLAGSAAAVAFLAGSSGDSLDVFAAGDSGPAVNVTLQPGEYLEHSPEKPRLAVSPSGGTVVYHLRDRDGVESYIHEVRRPGLDGRRHITADDRFNPYIDQESWLLFDRAGRLIFAAGHDGTTTDLYSVAPAAEIEVINLTRTGSGLLPPYLVKGTLTIDNLLELPGGSVLVSASGFAGTASGVIEISAVDGAHRIEEFGLSQAAGLYLAGSDLYFSAIKPSGENGLFRLRGGEILEAAASPAGMPPALLVETPELAIAGVPGAGLFELRPDAAPRLVAIAPSFAPAAALDPGGRWLVFGRQAPGGYEYFLLDLASGAERPLAGAPLAGQVLAAGGILQSPFIRGDSNGDGVLDISDPVRTLIHLFLGAAPLECPDSADADDSGVLEITDPIQFLDHLFLGGPPLPPPYPLSGFDPTPDALDCR